LERVNLLNSYYRSHHRQFTEEVEILLSNHGVEYDTAVEAYEELCLQLCNSSITEMKKLGKALTRNAIEILNFFDSRKTNAVLEGFNSVISLIKRKARGFKNMENYMAIIYFVCGELELPKATIM